MKSAVEKLLTPLGLSNAKTLGSTIPEDLIAGIEWPQLPRGF
jgi:hypothetical protein